VRGFCAHCYCDLSGIDATTLIDCRTGGRGCGVRFCKKECYLAMLTSKVHMVVCPKLQGLLLLLEKKKFRADRDTDDAAFELTELAVPNKSNMALVGMLAADAMIDNAAHVATALLGACQSLEQLSAFDLAFAVGHCALQSAKRGSVEEGMAVVQVGCVLQGQNKLDDAMAKYKAAAEIFEKVRGCQADVALCCFKMGVVLHLQGYLDDALMHHKKAAQMFAKVHGEEHETVVTCVDKMGLVLKDQGKFDKAQVHYEKVLPIYKKVCGGEHDKVATCCLDMGDVVLGQGKFDDALAFYEEALRIRKKLFGEDHIGVAHCFKKIGSG
jgi:tetratricopeptide (TPR) repeat protein